jgi:hypothetical protein
MKLVAIVPRAQRDIARELSDCIACLENSGIQVFATHRGHGYAVVWAEDPVIPRGVQVLRNAGFEAAPLTRTRSTKIDHRRRPVQITTSIATTVSE